MKNKLIITLSIVAIFSLVLSGAAVYKPMPERPERQPGTTQPGSTLRDLAAEDPEILQKSPNRGGIGLPTDILRPHAPSSVTPGASGLSFRFDSLIGVSQRGYPSDKNHLNSPEGLFIDSSGNLYVVENRGARRPSLQFLGK